MMVMCDINRIERLEAELSSIRSEARRLLEIRDMFPGIAWVHNEKEFFKRLASIDTETLSTCDFNIEVLL